MGRFLVFLAFAVLKALPMSVPSVKSRAVRCMLEHRKHSVWTWRCLVLGSLFFFSVVASTVVLAVHNENFCWVSLSHSRLQVVLKAGGSYSRCGFSAKF